ncbi:glycosyltransferase family 2 protein [Hyphomicrobium sp.]|uniref:glycosyltransferase family 2 protein n=1 Tax=Hyphomicrobium sp. TaxID=82 RepID=UPI0025BB2DF0|nr:glycosyltransferase family 2 protein [Hyphomicrobium sp.]MCC7253463.1 glycosyltransferase [Hyphomicrobium sp.]
MTELLRISIVVPSFNAASTIGRTLDSIISQNYPNLQLIVMDGASQDGTVAVIKKYADRIASWRSEKDKGQVDALNAGFRIADGDIHGYLCADDEFMPHTLATVAEAAASRPDIDVFTGGCQRDFNGSATVVTLPDKRFLERLDIVNTIEQPSTFWRAASHKAVGEFDLSFRYAFDWEYWCRLKKAGFKFAAIEEPLSVYHFSDSNLTSTGGRKIVDEMYRIVKSYGPRGGALADVYMWLYEVFDLRGYYDHHTEMPAWKRTLFYSCLVALYSVYGREYIDSYNWNFASRQERGLGWKAG